MIFTISIVVFFVLAVLLINWRWGVYLIVLAGFLQDPIRKIIPEQPVYFSVIVIFVFAMCLLLTFVINDKWRVKHLTLENQRMEYCLALYVVFIVFSSFFSFLSYNNLFIAVLGISIYLSPFLAAVYANMVFDKYVHIRNFIVFYLVGIGLVIISIWLSVFGYDFKIFEEIGGGIDIYEHSIHNYLQVHAGIVRTSELSAWHLATGACFSLILAIHSRKFLPKAIYSLLTLACLLTGIFTGRRKMYALFAVFCLMLLLFVIYESKGRQKSFALLSIGLLGVVFVSVYVTFQQQILILSFASDYLSRAFTVIGDAADRITLTINAFEYTLKQMSLVGSGIGTTGQGITEFADITAQWNAESGLGRLGNELGLVGFVILVLTSIVIFVHIISTNRIIEKYDVRLSFFQRALLAYLIANSVNYFTSAQAYNDLFVLLILGLVFGCILNLPKIFYFSLSKRTSLA